MDRPAQLGALGPIDVSGIEAPAAAPAMSRLWREVQAAPTILRIPAARRRLARAPRGDGHVLIDVPGWKAPEATGAPLRRYLRRQGYDARGWGLGVNTGTPEADALLLAERVVELAAGGSTVSLVGWSLGGVIVREVARQHPGSVRQVLTYGTPVIGGPTFTIGARSFGRSENERIAALNEQLDRDQPISTPLTVIFTRRDNVVRWQACLDHSSPDVQHFEVRSTHIGLTVDPDVWEVVAHRLAEVGSG